MDVILGIDVGGSATKIAGLRPDGSALSLLRAKGEDPLTSLYGAMGKYLSENGLSLENVRRVSLTGVGSSYADGDIFRLPTRRVDEFSAIGAGALALSGQDAALVASMGTGTAFLWAQRGKPVEHLCGSGIGGGTLSGLCKLLAGAERFGTIRELAAQGDLSRVDLTIRDVMRNPPATLDPSLTAANYGNVSENATPADLVAGTMNLALQAIGTMTVLACRCCGTKTAVLTGSLATLPQSKDNFRNFERLYGIRYVIPENALFATAIGAALHSLQEEPLEP